MVRGGRARLLRRSDDRGILAVLDALKKNGVSVVNPDTTEVYGAIGWKWLTAKYSHVVSSHIFGWAAANTTSGDTRGSGYLELNAAYDLGDLAHQGPRDPDEDVRSAHIELERAREIALEEARACADAFREKAANDLVSSLHSAAQEVASAELERVMRKMPDLDDQGREALEAAMRRTVRKLIHTPTVRAKEAASHGDDDLLTAARFLFGIPEEGAPGGNGTAPPDGL